MRRQTDEKLLWLHNNQCFTHHIMRDEQENPLASQLAVEVSLHVQDEHLQSLDYGLPLEKGPDGKAKRDTFPAQRGGANSGCKGRVIKYNQ